MAKKQCITTFVLVFALLIVFSAAAVGLNFVTGPIIERNNAARASGALAKVFPNGKGFEEVDLATLQDVADTVVSIHKETSGAGFVLNMSTTKGYTGNAIKLSFGVDSEGKIVGISLDEYPETKDFGAGYPDTFIGQDSTLAGVEIVAGCTYSSVAFRDAVADGMNTLIANGLMAAGVKSDEQILLELLPTVHSGLVNGKGIAQYDELEGDGTFAKILKAKNNSGYGYIAKDGDTTLLAVTNMSGKVRIINVEGADVTAQYAAIADSAKAHTLNNPVNTLDRDTLRMTALLEGATVTAAELPEVFNSVTNLYTLEKDGATYYGMVSRTYGYDNKTMGVYFVVDANGAIVGMNVDTLIFDAEYYHNYTLDPASYKEGFKGQSQDTFTGDIAAISGATYTADSIKQAADEIFAVYNILKGGAN
ncbi:MAG: FMN-binding protein [Clostridia bacterium]|nr:FMN-binding protein [Clostridia bacterium]